MAKGTARRAIKKMDRRDGRSHLIFNNARRIPKSRALVGAHYSVNAFYAPYKFKIREPVKFTDKTFRILFNSVKKSSRY